MVFFITVNGKENEFLVTPSYFKALEEDNSNSYVISNDFTWLSDDNQVQNYIIMIQLIVKFFDSLYLSLIKDLEIWIWYLQHRYKYHK